MILFMNFAPIRFMGGAERWCVDTARETSKYERTLILSVSSGIANIYGRLVLGREFTNRIHRDEERTLPENISMSFSFFVPFSKNNRKIRQLFSEARIIYTRYELLEISILMYFGGFRILKKTVAGMHSPFLYPIPTSFFDYLHKIVYESPMSKFFLKRMVKIHTVNRRDKKFLEKTFAIRSVRYIPNWIDSGISTKQSVRGKALSVLFAGELNMRKGIDIVISIVRKKPDNMIFHIVGDGPFHGAISRLHDQKLCIYHQYVSHKELNHLYEKCDVLLFPSRAESFGLVVPEAMSHGLKIVDAKDITLELPENIETSIPGYNFLDYYNGLRYVLTEKVKGKINREYIARYARSTFAKKVVFPVFAKEILCIKTR